MGATIGRLFVGALLVLACVGCSRGDDVREIATWTVVAPSGERHPLTLPARFAAEDLDADAHLVLETQIQVPPAWRGGPVTLAVPVFFGPMTLTAAGRRVPPREVAAAHAWRLDEVVAGEAPVPLRLDLDCQLYPSLGTPPRLSATDDGDGAFLAVRDFNFDSALVASSLLGLLALLYLVVFQLDRRRVEYGWLALMVTGAMTVTVCNLGAPRVTLRWVAMIAACAGSANVVSCIGFFRRYFLRAEWSWRWLWFATVPIAIGVAVRAPAARIDALSLFAAINLIGLVYVVFLVLAQLRNPAMRSAASTLSVASALTLLCLVPDIWADDGRREWLGGVRLIPVGACVYCLALATVLGRDLIRSMRESEARVRELEARGREIGELNEELRHQVVERSRDLTAALAQAEGQVIPVTLDTGEVFDRRYRVVRQLGRGGMGTVYEVERTRDGRHFALKVVTSALSARSAARFAREAEIGARVRHESLVSIVDVGVTEGATPFLVMELVRGGSMEEHRRRFGDARWASPILRQIAHGLAALHAQNVVHRDLKPANVLLVEGSGGPAAKISDFGISRFGALDDSADVDVEGDTMEHGASTDTTPLTQTGVIIGTPLYMPPEAGFGSARNPSADLFSFGVLAYEALTGQLPFPVPPVLLARGRQAIPPPRPLGGVDDEVTRLVMACLSLDPLERPRARDLASGL